MAKLNNNHCCVDRTGTVNSEGIARGGQEVSGQAPADRHQVIDRVKLQQSKIKMKRMKWHKEENERMIECWLRNEPDKNGFINRKERTLDEKGGFESSAQRLINQ